jgi:addiction module HigA family antidote
MMLKGKMRQIHPGVILNEELKERGLSRAEFTRVLHVAPNRVTALLSGRRTVTADTALRLARFFDNSPEMWMSMQSVYELRVAEVAIGKRIERTAMPAANASN